jgi:hypothetical protein
MFFVKFIFALSSDFTVEDVLHAVTTVASPLRMPDHAFHAAVTHCLRPATILLFLIMVEAVIICILNAQRRTTTLPYSCRSYNLLQVEILRKRTS